jgi:hypothetical protein
MSSKIIQYPGGDHPDERASNESEAKRQRFLIEWVDRVLAKLGYTKAIANAASILELATIVFDLQDPEVSLQIREVLFPAAGKRPGHFRGLKEDTLRRLLRGGFERLKLARKKALGTGSSSGRNNWENDLILNPKGKIATNLFNLTLILRKAPKWQGVLGYDEFAGQVVIRGGPRHSPPWSFSSPDTPWSDYHEAQTRIWFHSQLIDARAGDVGRAVQTAARDNTFHPVRDYFGSLVWDGVPRLDDWLITYCHATDISDNKYLRAIGPRYLISGVARIFDPGCKADYMIILEHDQGKQKSEFLRALCPRPEWFTDSLSHIKSKDAALETAGVFMVEVAEMEPLLRPSSSAAKAFVTRRFERVRPPWGTHPVRRGRQFIFSGTVNPPETGYFRDPTGSRRYWPVKCGRVLDIQGIEAVRDQLWAEAVFRFKAKEKWWLPPELEPLAEAEQDQRYHADPWHETVRTWVSDRPDVTVTAVLEQALGFPPQSWTVGAERRVGAILTRLKFKKTRPYDAAGERHRIYHRDSPPPQAKE